MTRSAQQTPPQQRPASGGALVQCNTPAEMTASEFLRQLKDGQISVYEYVDACAQRIEQLDGSVRAWHKFDGEMVRTRARALDGALAGGTPRRALAGVPVAVKDIFNTYDYPTGMGSPIMDNYTPGNDARLVSDLRLAQGIIMGKAVTAEFAVHHPGPTRNPHDLERSPGTSSSGSAAAVAARMAPLALSSQTGGSTIRPASYCGVYGFKPSFGLLPRTGVLKTTDTLDSLGFMARSVEDLSLIFEVCCVQGHNYPVSAAALDDIDRQTVTGRPWRVGVVRGPKTNDEAAEPRAGLDALIGKLEQAGCEPFEYDLAPEFDAAHDAHERIYRSALAYYFDLEWQADSHRFSPVLQHMIESGSAISAQQYRQDIATQRDLARLIERDSGRFDVLIGLSTADEAPLGLEGQDQPDHCLIWTMCGLPTMSLPMLAGSSGLPVGVQIVARRYNDPLLLSFAELLSRVVAT
jgi:Asp-tRNA(Asn)/Glu-tRNA(Gln) amidotransferase A subunit family amidase